MHVSRARETQIIGSNDTHKQTTRTHTRSTKSKFQYNCDDTHEREKSRKTIRIERRRVFRVPRDCSNVRTVRTVKVSAKKRESQARGQRASLSAAHVSGYA